MPYCTVLCCTVLYFTVICCTVLYSVLQVIVYIPTSHVLQHQADMLSLQLLHDSAPRGHGEPEHGGGGCWHGKQGARVIHTQNITFNKDPGRNIKGGRRRING